MVTKAMIDDLKAREGDARRKYDEASKRRKDAEIEMAWQKSGIKPGDKVIYRGGEYAAIRFDPNGWLMGAKIKKNGEPSASEVHLYRGWKKAEQLLISNAPAACDVLAIKTPDAPEPTGEELVGKVCEFSDDGKVWGCKDRCVAHRWYAGGDMEEYDGEHGGTYSYARLHREDRP